MTAKSKSKAKTAGVAGAILSIAAGAYTINLKGIPGCSANSVAKETFETYVQEHKKFGETALNGIDEKFTAIKESLDIGRVNDREWRMRMDGKLDQLIGLMITRRADAGGTWNEECAFP